MNTLLETGTVLLNKYRVEAAIGEGGFGAVYKATDILLKRTLAIKTLLYNKNTITSREDVAVFEEFLDRFRREAEVSSYFTANPNIITVYGLEKDEKQNYYLLIEYLDGGSLDHLVQHSENKRLPVARACSIALDLCHALIDIHNHPTDIVHRDIKPTNVLLRSKGGAVLADFGIAQVGHDSHRTVLREDGKVIRHPGSPPYRSPEQTNGVDYLTPASDLYSLGLVIYEMLTGRMYAKYSPKHPPSGLNSEVPAWLDAVVDKLLKVKLEDRYQQAEDVSADIQAGLAGKPVGAIKVPVEAALPKAEVAAPAELSDDDRRAAAVKDRKLREADERAREWAELEKRWLDEINDQEYQKRAQIEAEAQDRVAAEEAEKVRQATEAELARQQQMALTKQVADMSAQLAYYELRGEWGRAIEFGETIHRLDPQNQAIMHRLVELYRSRAHASYSQGQFDRALLDLNQALELDLDAAECYYDRGLTYYQRGEYDRALLDLNRAIELDLGSSNYYYGRALVYHQKQDFHRAITDFGRAIEREPGVATYYYHRGLSYEWRGATFFNKDDQEFAFADFDRAVQLEPTNPVYFYHRAMGWRKKGDTAHTLQDLDRVISLDNTRADYYYQRGLSHTQNKTFDAAIQDFSRAIELDPHQANYYYWRGLTYKAKRDRRTARRDLQLAVDMGHPKARADLATL